MDEANSDLANQNAVAKREFITAFFDDAENRAAYLLDLHAKGRDPEATTLCLVYIDSFSQWLFWPRSRTGQNFVQALVDHGGDPEFALIHPLAAIRAFETMKNQWKNFATKLRSHFPGPEYSLFEKHNFLTELAADFTDREAKLLGVELWRGTIANVVYTRLRNPSVHSFRRAAEISFDSTTHHGQPARPINFRRLHKALLKIIAEARARSMANNQWFGDDKIVKGA